MTAAVLAGFPIAMCLFLWASDRLRWLPVAFFALAIIVLPLFADSEDWNLFDWLKRSFIILPAFLCALAQYLAQRKRLPIWTAHGFAAVGFANVAIFVVTDIAFGHYGNALFGISLLISYPFLFRYDESGVVGFKDRFWVVMFVLCDAIFIHYYAGIENSYYFVMAILPIEILMLVLMKDWHKAFSFRVYSLGAFLVVDSLFDFVSDYAYLPAFHPEARITTEGLAYANWLAAALGTYVIVRWAVLVVRRRSAGNPLPAA